MTTPASMPPGSTPDPERPGVYWYPKPERIVIDAAQYAKPDSRDARITQLETALRHIRTLALDAPSLAMNMTDGDIFDAIALCAVDALAGAQPAATVYEELVP